jgi:replicative DNA helicase
VLIAAEDIKIKAREGLLEGDELLDLATSKIAGIERPVGTGTVDGLSTFDEFLDREADSEPWLIPGLLRRSWRTMLVAPEGVGKSMVARALVLGASQGLAPFGGPNFEPIRCLMIDCENPEDAVRSTCKPIRARAKMHTSEYASWRSWLWHRPGGLNIRTRTDRQDLERVIAAAQPDLVCAGPMYKLYRPGKEGDEQAGLDVMNLFDDLRTRYGFALVLEHHAPKAQGASNIRELVPYGTSLWLRWPELGIKLIPSSDSKDSLELGRFRPDRMPTAWPDRLDRGIQGAWPWTGYWKNGDMP